MIMNERVTWTLKMALQDRAIEEIGGMHAGIRPQFDALMWWYFSFRAEMDGVLRDVG